MVAGVARGVRGVGLGCSRRRLGGLARGVERVGGLVVRRGGGRTFCRCGETGVEDVAT